MNRKNRESTTNSKRWVRHPGPRQARGGVHAGQMSPVGSVNSTNNGSAFVCADIRQDQIGKSLKIIKQSMTTTILRFLKLLVEVPGFCCLGDPLMYLLPGNMSISSVLHSDWWSLQSFPWKLRKVYLIPPTSHRQQLFHHGCLKSWRVIHLSGDHIAVNCFQCICSFRQLY